MDDDKVPYKEIVEYLNKSAGKKFNFRSDATRKIIKTRWKLYPSLEDFQFVIDLKCKEWKDNPEMNKYLRPETLFGNKFDRYLNEAAPIPSIGERKPWEV